MDTLVLQRPQTEKMATSAAGIFIAVFLLIFLHPNILANDIINVTGLSPDITAINNKIYEEEGAFNQNIIKKYKNTYISDVDKGVKHIKFTKYYGGKPVRINVVEISQNVNDELIVEPAIANSKLQGKNKISTIANRENAIVAINGGYFKPQTGTPLGALMINKKVYTSPIYDRVGIGFFDDGYKMSQLRLDAALKTNLGNLKINNINQPRMLSTHVNVYTEDWGKISAQTPKYGIQMSIQDKKILQISHEPIEIPIGGYVISGPENLLKQYIKAKDFTLDVKMSPDWTGVNHILSGGPYLIKDGEIYVDITAEKLNSVGGRNPRTAIGYTNDNHLILLTADGREGSSIGLTLNELALLMKQLNCVNAMNLDGGGSTVMYVNGQVVNKPAIQGGIPLSHTLIIRKDYKLSKI